MTARLRELYRYRELLENLVVRDLKVRYKNSALGFLWSLLNPLLLMIVFSVLAALAAVLVQMAISREREYLADATSVRLTRNPMSMISALEKLSTRNTPMEHANKAVQHLYIVNPFKQFTARSSALFSTHPSLEQRIARIKDLR